jgi:hypothetical protein
MKTHLIFTITLVFANLTFAQPTQIQIQSRYEGIDPSFTKDIQDKMTKDFTMPKITVKSGHQAVIEMIKEYGFGHKSGETGVRSSGATVSIIPTIQGSKVLITGKNVLCRPDSWQSKSPLNPISFSSLETFFEGTVSPNQDITVRLSEHSSGRLILRFMLMDNEGMPVK